MTLNEYLNSLRGKSLSVLGLGISNRPLVNLLLSRGLDVTIRDKRGREAFGELGSGLEACGAKLILGDNYLRNLVEDVIFRSPGIMPYLPEIAAAVEHGAVLTSEMEAFFEVCPCKIIAVTGSDGKTTTTTLIGEMLRAEGKTVHVGGNIGTPLLDRTDTISPGDFVVLELSSFQLITMKRSPNVAVVTNLGPNHLDIHADLKEYIDSKKNIFLHQNVDDRLVLNFDNELTHGFAADAKCAVLPFSMREMSRNGVFLRENMIICAEENGEMPVLDTRGILIPGAHNIENYMAAIAATRGFVSSENVNRVAREFGGVAHRIELVRTLDGVRYYNSSIDSSPARTIAALGAFDQKVILIAGGKDKGVPFDSLGPALKERVKALVLTGMTAEPIKLALERTDGYGGVPEITVTEGFEDAVLEAQSLAKEGDIVLLSPASTSFDRFSNFEERGNKFKEIVNGLT